MTPCALAIFLTILWVVKMYTIMRIEMMNMMSPNTRKKMRPITLPMLSAEFDIAF
jgi:hypothetical protein